MNKYLAVLYITTFVIIATSGTVMSTPFWVETDVSSITSGTYFELDLELYNNNYFIGGVGNPSRIGDSYVFIDDVCIKNASGAIITPPGLIGFESGALEGFDDSLDSGYITVVPGAWWSGACMMRIDEDPLYTPTVTWQGFIMPSGANKLRFEFEFIGSGVPGDSGLDQFVAKLLDQNLYPFPSIPGLTGFGDFLAVDSSGIQKTSGTNTAPIPEPSTILLMLVGLGSIVALGKVRFSWEKK
jgi:hypothetical protein